MAPDIDVVAIFGFFQPFSSLSHLLGASVFAALTVSLLAKGGESLGKSVSLAVFAFSAVVLLCISGVYHSLSPGPAREFTLRLDSAGIFVLIAATYTPIHTILFRGLWRWGFLCLIWGLAIVCAVFKTLYFASFPHWLSLTLYLGLGWLGLWSARDVSRRYSLSFIQLVIAGGVAYTVGGVLNLIRQPTVIPGVIGPHEMLHIAVLIGLGCHWCFIDRIAAAAPSVSIPKAHLPLKASKPQRTAA